MANDGSGKAEPYLTLGWQVNQFGDPNYWLRSDAKAGDQPENELGRIPATAMGTHTVIVGQSGSGKSSFLGRLVEELLTQIEAHCLIFDPNADFRRCHEVEDASLWASADYNLSAREGELPHEKSRDEFESGWSKVGKCIFRALSAERNDPDFFPAPYAPLKLWWPDVSIDFLAEGLTPKERSELYHCHAATGWIGKIVEDSWAQGDGPKDIIQMSEANWRQYAQSRGISTMVSTICRGYKGFKKEEDLSKLIELYDSLVMESLKYVTPATADYYFARAKEYVNAGVIATSPPPDIDNGTHLEVVDLPSLGDEASRSLAVSVFLKGRWDEARSAWNSAQQHPTQEDERVPTFISIG